MNFVFQERFGLTIVVQTLIQIKNDLGSTWLKVLNISHVLGYVLSERREKKLLKFSEICTTESPKLTAV